MFENLNITLVAPFGTSNSMSCRSLGQLMRFRVSGNTSFLYVLTAANRTPYLARRRGSGVARLIGSIGGNHIGVLGCYNNGGATTIIRRVGGDS